MTSLVKGYELKPKQNPSRVKLRSRLLVGVTMPTRSLSYAKTPNWSYPLAYTARLWPCMVVCAYKCYIGDR
eukprot:8796335-Pyramimonas_sp.AAC.1